MSDEHTVSSFCLEELAAGFSFSVMLVSAYETASSHMPEDRNVTLRFFV